MSVSFHLIAGSFYASCANSFGWEIMKPVLFLSVQGLAANYLCWINQPLTPHSLAWMSLLFSHLSQHGKSPLFLVSDFSRPESSPWLTTRSILLKINMCACVCLPCSMFETNRWIKKCILSSACQIPYPTVVVLFFCFNYETCYTSLKKIPP